MCGIAGILYSERDRLVDPRVLDAMGRSLWHRGPDGSGTWIEPGVGLAHRRLAIIDPAAGRQPIGNEDDSIQIVFNGEIYNYRTLRDGLVARGHRFRTQSDTEVLVHLYEECGPDFVDQLRGMFALAIWDRPRGRLTLARDRIGIKPLYLYRDAKQLLFGSEPKAILAYGIDRSVDPRALEDYLCYGFVPGPRSIFRGIEKWPAGHMLTVEVDNGRFRERGRRYWAPAFDSNGPVDEANLVTSVSETIDSAVLSHLVADVPVGAFLSGGIDSSIVVESASRHLPAMHTFSIGFREAGYDELPHARRVAGRFGTRHIEQVVSSDSAEALEGLTEHYDEPFADPSAIPTLALSRMAAEHVKVVLSGDGGDEAFGGYSRSAHHLWEPRIRSGCPAAIRTGLLGPLGRRWPKADYLPRIFRAKTLLENLSRDPATAYAYTLSTLRSDRRRSLLSSELIAELGDHDPEREMALRYPRDGERDHLAGMIAVDLAATLVDGYLVKVDRASMAHGLEVRPPLLDHELLESALAMPSMFKIRDGQTKWILKRTYDDRLPPGILDRPKQGFEVPLSEWFRGSLHATFRDRVLSPSSIVGDWIDRDRVARLLQRHRSGLGDESRPLWTLMVLAAWADRYLNAPTTPSPDLEAPTPTLSVPSTSTTSPVAASLR